VDDLKALRRRKHLTQKELAARVGVSGQTIRAWEGGTSQPHAQYIPKLAEALGIDAEQLPGMLAAAATDKRRRALLWPSTNRSERPQVRHSREPAG
jgi:transcriptional regulator with XRE-family HTH domain